ncbi:MAG: beta-ketoacyl synthase chain length factor [Chitinophagaceae bacterium]
MFYIHQSSCISAQQTFANADINRLLEAVDNKLLVKEPSYDGIPTGILRRMGKAIRIGVGTALPLLRSSADPVAGIIIGTADGGMEDCIKFLNQIIDYDEGMLTPTNFVQSTTNAIAAQIGLLSANKSYNITHVHRGLAFENALLDADMLVKENATASYLVGGVDEISTYNYNIEHLGGWYKKEPIAATGLYSSGTIGSIAGEGAAMFIVNAVKANALCKVTGMHMLHTEDKQVVSEQMKLFLDKHLPVAEQVDLLLTGENGDSRLLHYYTQCEAVLNKQATVARFKHMTGEYASASAAALWLVTKILKDQDLPAHMIKYASTKTAYNRVLIYNTQKGKQHSFILAERTNLK